MRLSVTWTNLCHAKIASLTVLASSSLITIEAQALPQHRPPFHRLSIAVRAPTSALAVMEMRLSVGVTLLRTSACVAATVIAAAADGQCVDASVVTLLRGHHER